MTLTDDDLRARLAAADPWPAPDLTDVLTPLVARHTRTGAAADDAADGVAPVVRLPLRHSRRWAIAGTGVAVAFALTAAGLASGAWTGEHAAGTPDGTQVVDGVTYRNEDGTDTSELLDLTHPDARAVVLSLVPRDVPLPTWMTWEDAADDIVVEPVPGEPGTVVSARGVTTMLYHQAATAWQVQWFEARAAGDDAGADRALDAWEGALRATRWAWEDASWQGVEELVAAVRGGDAAAMLYDLEADASPALLARIGADGDASTVDDLPGLGL